MDIDPDVMQDFLIWLKSRESDIEHGIEDFDELRELFFILCGRNAGESEDSNQIIY